MRYLLASLALLLLTNAVDAQSSRAVMEGVRTSDNTILISTRTKRVLVSTTVYNGAIPNVGLYTSSNVVISDQASNKCVIYATGSLSCLDVTASRFASNGANCSAASFPLGVDASGAVESCSTSISGNAATATALAANGANCSASSYPLGVDASGAVESCGTTISGNAGTATALAANGANCSTGNYPLGVDAYGNVESCTAGGGDVEEASDNVFTGQNRFNNKTSFSDSIYIAGASTIGPQDYSTSLVTSSGTLNNIWEVLASQFPNGVDSSTFTGFGADRFFRIHYSLKHVTSASILTVNINGDYGNNYAVSNECLVSNASGDNYVSAGVGFWRLNGTSNVAANGYDHGFIEFASIYDNNTWVDLYGLGTMWANTANPPIMVGCRVHAVYTGSSTLSKINFRVSAGTMTGYIWVEKMNVPNP